MDSRAELLWRMLWAAATGRRDRRARDEAGARARRRDEEQRRRDEQREEETARESRQRQGEERAREEQRRRREAASEPMTVELALEILGLKAGAGEEEIRAAYTRLIQRVHPDVGGSDFFAKQLNAARDLLLRQKKRTG
jgi:hypothetical protein